MQLLRLLFDYFLHCLKQWSFFYSCCRHTLFVDVALLLKNKRAIILSAYLYCEFIHISVLIMFMNLSKRYSKKHISTRQIQQQSKGQLRVNMVTPVDIYVYIYMHIQMGVHRCVYMFTYNTDNQYYIESTKYIMYNQN